MKNPLPLFAFLAAFSLYVPSTEAQTPIGSSPVTSTPTTSPAPTGSVTNAGPEVTPSSQTDVQTSPEKMNGMENSDGEDKPFIPHWSGQVGLTYSNQPSQQGQGQIQKELGLSGTYDFTEDGNFISTELIGGEQLVEGVDTNYGQFNLTGGLGLGIFLPSLEMEMQRGASALDSNTLLLTFNFRLFDSLEIGPLVGAGLESHQAPASLAGIPKLGLSDRIVEYDSGNISGGLMITFIPTDFLTLSLTGQQEYDDTYQYQNVIHTVSYSLNQRDRIPSLTLGENITFLKNFELDLSQQAGQEFYPAGLVYSPIRAKLVYNATPTSATFTGFSTGLMYNFE